ncbi:MAG TPA: hypothetical protein VHI10_08030 [Mycobacterium sp.]|nr:hypothetical protein [Mycobacterium sp.]
MSGRASGQVIRAAFLAFGERRRLRREIVTLRERGKSMKRAFLGTIAAVVLTIGSGAAAAQAASPSNHITFKDQTASAFFESSSDCLATYAYVFAADGRINAGNGTRDVESGAYVSVSRYDYCTAAFMYADGFTSLSADAFQINKSVATLDTTVELNDNVGGRLVISLDISWSGHGDITRQTSHQVFRSPNFKQVYHFVGSSQTASAVGSVTTSDTTNFAPGPAQYASMGSSKSGYLDTYEEDSR